MDKDHYEYDIGLSFAGEQREFVKRFASELESRGVRVFYDEYEKAGLWGKDLYSHLALIYGELCRYCVLFASAQYADKVWTNHERCSAQARALEENREYILPVRFDDTPIPGLLETIHYVDLSDTSLSELVKFTLEKLGNPQRQNYLPPVLDLLCVRLGVDDKTDEQAFVHSQANSFFRALQRMGEEEREVVFSLFQYSCPADLPENLHISTDLLRRITGRSVPVLKKILGGLRSLGFECTIREDKEHEFEFDGEPLGDFYLFELRWDDLGEPSPIPALLVASTMVNLATENYCEQHGAEFLKRLDFSQLSHATRTTDSH